jgi:hypothetical protein
MDSKGHEYLSNESIAEAVKYFPPTLNWLKRILQETMVGAVYIDVEDVFTRGHWTQEGQKHHFMRFDGQSPLAAYDAGVLWIKTNAHTAGQRIREILKTKPRTVNPIWIGEPMGLAMHALQDSYAEGHVSRKKDGNDFVITNVQVYDYTNQHAHDDWPGHKALDEKWKSDALGKEAIIAGRELVRLVVVSSIVKTDAEFEPRFGSLWDTFLSMFLVSRFESAK